MIKVGSFVRHAAEDLGTGRVVALLRGSNVALVLWHFGTRRHDLRAINLVEVAR